MLLRQTCATFLRKLKWQRSNILYMSWTGTCDQHVTGMFYWTRVKSFMMKADLGNILITRLRQKFLRFLETAFMCGSMSRTITLLVYLDHCRRRRITKRTLLCVVQLFFKIPVPHYSLLFRNSDSPMRPLEKLYISEQRKIKKYAIIKNWITG